MKSKKSDTVFKNYLKTKLCEEILILWNSNYTENISDVCLQSSEFIMGVVETLIKCGFLQLNVLKDISSLLQMCISHQISKSVSKQKVITLLDSLSNVTPALSDFYVDVNSKYINSKDYKRGVSYVQRIYVKSYS